MNKSRLVPLVLLGVLFCLSAAAETAPPPPAPAPVPAQAQAPAKKFRIAGTHAAVAGVRGLDEESLKAAQPNPKAVSGLEAYATKPDALGPFCRQGKERLVPIAGGNAISFPADEEDEARVGAELAAAVLGAAPPVKSKKIQRYVNQVGTWVAQQSERPKLKWRFAVIDTDSINAFAVPGGYVFVTRGLYETLRNEAELASVLGHEIAHIVSRDHYKILKLSESIRAGGEAAKNVMSRVPGFKNLSALTLDHAVMVFAFALDKSAELAADQMGTMLAADSGYQPFGLTHVLDGLAKTKKDDSRVSLLLKTHPDPAERLKALEGLRQGRLASKEAAPALKDRFEKNRLAPRT
jgi:beta-barrel assembly-enhancing protease